MCCPLCTRLLVAWVPLAIAWEAVWVPQGKTLTFGIPASVGVPQRQAVAACHAAGPGLYRVVTAWDEIPFRLGVFDVVTCPVGEIGIIHLLLGHLLPMMIWGPRHRRKDLVYECVGPVEPFGRRYGGKREESKKGGESSRMWRGKAPDKKGGAGTDHRCTTAEVRWGPEASFVPGPLGGANEVFGIAKPVSAEMRGLPAKPAYLWNRPKLRRLSAPHGREWPGECRLAMDVWSADWVIAVVENTLLGSMPTCTFSGLVRPKPRPPRESQQHAASGGLAAALRAENPAGPGFLTNSCFRIIAPGNRCY